MNATRISRENDFISYNMGKPASISLVVHLAVFILATVGLPFMAHKPEPMEMAITVDIVDVAEVSQTNLDAPPEESKVPDIPVERKPVYNNTDAAPDLLSPQEPDVEEVLDIPEPPKDPPKPDLTKIEKPPKPKNKPRKPKPQPKPEEQVKEKPKEDQKDFTSLLKSLTLDEPEEGVSQAQTQDTQGQTSQIADFGKQMTRSELDDLNRGVQPCWNVNAGGKNAEDLIVSLRVFVNPDFRVRDVQIIDQVRYSTDTHFQAAAEAARRALLNPRCSTLRLPPEKYDYWKVFIYTFDPSKML